MNHYALSTSRFERVRVTVFAHSIHLVARRDQTADFDGEDEIPLDAKILRTCSVVETRRIAVIAWGERKSRCVGAPEP
jgi:hypothetical protein